jgi:HSP20 family molecular chaperone IbpA
MAKGEKKRKTKGVAEGVIREFGFGGLLDVARKSQAFRERLEEANRQMEENIRRAPHRSLRPHAETGYSVRRIVEEPRKQWRVKKPTTVVPKSIRKLAPRGPKRTDPPVDIFDEGDHLRVVAELPGIEERDIRTEVKGDMLTISAEGSGRRYNKQVKIPAPVTSGASSTYKHGVLEVKLKKAGAGS